MQRGLGSFIQGAFGGYTYGEDLKDKKKDRERKSKDDDWLAKSRERQEESWERDDAWTDKTRARQETVWGRTDTEYNRAEKERSVLAAIGQDAEDSYAEYETYGGTPVQPDDPSAGAPQGPEGAAVSADPARRPADQPEFERGAPQYAQGYGAPQAPRQPRGLGQAAMSGTPAVQSAQQVPAGMPRVAQRPQRPAETDQPMPSWQPSAAGQDAAQIAETARRELQTGLNSQTYEPLTPQETEMRRQYVVGAGNQAPAANEGQGPDVGRATPQMAGPAPTNGQQPVTPAAQSPVPRSVVQQPAPPQGGPDAPVNTSPAAAVAPQDQAEAAADFEQAVTAPPDKGGAPSLASAAETAPKPKGVVGPNGAVKTTKAQADRASKSFLDHYAETAVPKIIQYYASQGNIEKAQAFETWAGSREARGQLESWGKAVHAATIGDDDAFLDHMSDTYNSYDDGYEVIRAESGFERGSDGAVTGAQITFKNVETGETFVKKYEDQADIIREGLYALSPEQVFENLWGQLSQAGEVAADQRKFERSIILEQVKAGAKAPASNADDIAGAKKALSEQLDFGEWAKLTPDQQTQMAIEYVQSNRAAGAALAAPQQQPLPDLYLGD
jgi:hypothetical protein